MERAGVTNNQVRKVEMKISEDILDLDVFLSCDESQVEVRELAEVSGDELLIKQFKTGQDIHCLVGNVLTGWSVERIKNEKNLRKMVKNMHFGIIFGLERKGLYPYVVAKIRAIDGEKADLTGITPKRLGLLYDKYFQRYPGVRSFIERMREQAENSGYVETLFGFRRWIFQNDSSRNTFSGNQAINSPIQGTAHTFILIALALLHMKPQTFCLLQRCIAEIHDQLIFRVKLRDLPEAYKQIMNLMQFACAQYAERHWKRTLQVPLVAEASAGFCMGSMVEYNGGAIDIFLTEWKKKHNEVETEGWKKFSVPV
jgi:DNA polymerase-1